MVCLRAPMAEYLRFEKVPLDTEKDKLEVIRNVSGLRTKPTMMEATSRITPKL